MNIPSPRLASLILVSMGILTILLSAKVSGAQTLTGTLSGVTFSDGSTASGSFTFTYPGTACFNTCIISSNVTLFGAINTEGVAQNPIMSCLINNIVGEVIPPLVGFRLTDPICNTGNQLTFNFVGSTVANGTYPIIGNGSYGYPDNNRQSNIPIISGSLTISGAPTTLTITTASLPSALSGKPYSTALVATGGQGTIEWKIAPGSSLPVGFMLASTGILTGSGSPAAPPTITSFIVIATDSTNMSTQKTLSLTVTDLAITASLLDNQGSPTLTETTPVTAQIQNMTVPLGANFSIQLFKNNKLIKSSLTLGSPEIFPPISDPSVSLFAGFVLIPFTDSQSSNIFQAVHLGDIALTLAPDNPSIPLASLLISVTTPGSLGNTNTDVDSLLVALSHKTGIPPHMIKGQIQQESAFDPMSYRYEPLTSDLGTISTGQNLRLQAPYALYRLATDDGLSQGATILPADIVPRSIYDIEISGTIRAIQESDTMVAALNIFDTNDDTQNWSTAGKRSAAVAKKVAANPSLLNFTAQTPLAASYGYLQILYSTAISAMDWQGVNGAHNPSFLFDTTTNQQAGGGSLELGTGYLAGTAFATINPKIATDNPSFNDMTAFNNSFVRAFNFYNHGKAGGKYGKAVLINSGNFLPVLTGNIFH